MPEHKLVKPMWIDYSNHLIGKLYCGYLLIDLFAEKCKLFSISVGGNNRQFNQPTDSVNPANNELQLYNIMNNLNNPSTVTSYKPQTFTDNNNK